MKNQKCGTCSKTKALLECGLCQTVVCKYCAHFLDEESFSYFANIPKVLTHSIYCHPCFTENVSPKLDEYNEMMEKSKNIMVYTKTQSKETRLMKRTEDPVSIVDVLSEEEALLRLAFKAVEAGFNGLIDVVLISNKVKMSSYQTTKWSGHGIPTNITEKSIIRDRSFTKAPN